MTFNDLELINPLMRALGDAGYTKPTPVQERAIPHVLAGRDMVACAQTGTGKTAAFSIPLLQNLHESGKKRKNIRALILTPTRELAIQIEQSLTDYGKYLPLRHTVVYGGVSQNPQVSKIRKGIDILVATPGRLLDLMGQGHIHLNNLEVFVLDEADRMLDMGFINDVRKVIKVLPKKRQTLLFSATMPGEIQDLAKKLLHQPVKVEVTPPSTTVEKIDQSLYYTNRPDKRKLLLHLLKEKNIGSALVFTRTKHGADKVARFLSKSGFRATAIHGNKSQNARQKALSDFKRKKITVLVATDIAARGIDIDELSYVFNFDLPEVAETYVHRIGRTGRAGNEGSAISFCDSNQKSELKGIQKLINNRLNVVSEHPYPMTDSEEQPKASGGRGGKRKPKRNFKRRSSGSNKRHSGGRYKN
ncbi:MAG: DEAD/DEAH box helicase [Saprospirales bacterium]|nr:MAG: DEAD/DEAH box helicase [Saprospirales bacterium]